MERSLLRYRVMAYVVGTLLVILTVGVVLRYATADHSSSQHAGEWITTYVGVAHGWLYMVFLVVAALLARQARWTIPFSVLVLLSGLIPFGTFIVERRATAYTLRKMQAAPTPSAQTPA